MDFEKIKKHLLKLVAAALPRLAVVIYPTKKVMDTYYSLSLAIVKSVSFDRAKIGSMLFDQYFGEILSAKTQQKSLTIKPNLAEIGAVIETAKLTYTVSIILLGIMYISFVFLIPGTLVSVFQSMGLSLKLIVALIGFMVVYYSIIVIKLALQLFKKQIPSHILKSYLKDEFSYVYAKAAEIDGEAADMTIDYLKESLLIRSDDHYALHIQKLDQKIEETK